MVADRPDPLSSQLNDQLLVANVAFGEEVVEIDFFDPRRQSPGFMEFTKLAIDRAPLVLEIEDIEERLRDLIDEALSRRRK